MNNTAIKKVEKKQSIKQASRKNQQKLVYQIDVMSVKMFLMSANGGSVISMMQSWTCAWIKRMT